MCEAGGGGDRGGGGGGVRKISEDTYLTIRRQYLAF